MTQQTIQAIVDELTAAGASENAIRGVLANAKDESGFNSALRHPDQPKFGGEAHYAHGLYQEGGSEWNNYSNWLKQNNQADWTDPKLQTKFLAQNLKDNYPTVWDKMNNSTPEQAAQTFVSGYLKPAKQFEEARRAQYGQGVPKISDFIQNSGGGDAQAAGLAPQNVPGISSPQSATGASLPGAPTPFQTALADFDSHMNVIRQKYPQQGSGNVPPGMGQNPGGTQQNALMNMLRAKMALQPSQPQQSQQANYGGISSPNYAAAGGPSNGMTNMLQLMMQGRQNSNILALLSGQAPQNNSGGATS